MYHFNASLGQVGVNVNVMMLRMPSVISALTVSLRLAVCSRCEYGGVPGKCGGRPRKRAEDFQVSSHVFWPEWLLRLTLDEAQRRRGGQATPGALQYTQRQQQRRPSSPPRRVTLVSRHRLTAARRGEKQLNCNQGSRTVGGAGSFGLIKVFLRRNAKKPAEVFD